MTRPHDVVGEKAEKGTVAHHVGCLVHGMSQAEWLLLNHRTQLDVLQTGERALDVEMLGEEMAGVEVDDHDRLLGPRPGGLLDRVLDGGTIDHGQ